MSHPRRLESISIFIKITNTEKNNRQVLRVVTEFITLLYYSLLTYVVPYHLGIARLFWTLRKTVSVIQDMSWRNFRYYFVVFLEGINKSSKKLIWNQDPPLWGRRVCHTVNPDIRSIDEMCVRTDRPTIELFSGVSGCNI